MKRVAFIFLCLSVAFIAFAKTKSIVITLQNPSLVNQFNAPVVISVSTLTHKTGVNVQSVAVYEAGKLIPSQLDDFNHDGKPDELAFLVSIPAKHERILTLKVASDSSLFTRFPEETHAQMFLRNKTTHQLIPTREASSPTGNLYQALQHHGPAFESKIMAFRIYFDKKQTVDLYGKKHHELELAQDNWYPSDEQIAHGFGDDILWVKETAGCGTLKGWNGTQALHIAPVSNRTARVITDGPVRAIIEMEADGWQYEGKKIQLKERYILYAGHRDVEVQVNQNDTTTLCAGVQTIFDKSQIMSPVKGVVAIWGTGLQYPKTDNKRAMPQTVGLAVSMPYAILQKSTKDADNLLLIVKGKSFTYHFAAAWSQEIGGYKSANQFFHFVRTWDIALRHPVKIVNWK
ncbi:DUF4861 domain-containing protein [Microbacter margulisiae]|uniref:DUF4861 domain-containing protein n=1 Tax=Microbacter margulisiae TaxID=1350067 RepID=A0A7W5DP11_9PORP|nr:DUF4861 domain-containing protein [Microbacter margulisiae]MBB3186286.1 hypothetical protein [Microbacter margulisiae]